MNQPELGAEPVALPPTDLAAVFGRNNTLRGRLHPVPVSPPPAVGEDLPAGQPVSGAATETITAKPQQGSTSAGSVVGGAGGIIIYVQVGLRERLRQRRSRDGSTFGEIVLDAVEATHDQFDTLLAGAGPRTERSGLFVRSVKTAGNAEPHVQVYVRVTAENLDVLDGLVRRHRAPNRSALLAAALDAYLT